MHLHRVSANLNLNYAQFHHFNMFMLGNSGIITVSTYLILVFGGKLHIVTALTMFVGGSTAAAIADVTIDALVAMKSRERPEFATHIQTFCNMCQSLGSLSGFLLSGLAVHALGSQVCQPTSTDSLLT